jgi:hypothetical protein
MSLSHESAHDDQLVRYLLGLLTEEEAENVDALCVADDETASRLQALENDLVDGYVSGTLSGPSLTQFQRVYLTSSRRREKVRFAESLHEMANRIPAPLSSDRASNAVQVAGSRPRSRGTRWFERLAWPVNTGWGLAAAAGVVLVVVGLLECQALQLRHELQAVQGERQALVQRAQDLAQRLGEEQAASTETARQLDQVRGELTDAARTVPDTRLVAQPPGVLAAMLLLPQMRSAGPIPTLVVPPRAQTAAFDLLLEPSEFRTYQVLLRNPATNDVVWRSERLTPASSGRARMVSIAVPVRVFKTQHYAFELSGVSDGGAADAIAGYAFRIVLR